MTTKTLIFLGVIVLAFIGSNCLAQSDFEKLIDKQDFDKYFKKISKKIEKEPDDVKINLEFSIFYNLTENPQYNSDSAYYYAQNAKILLKKVDAKERSKLIKDEITPEVIDNQIIKICKNAFNDARTKNSIGSFNYFIGKFPDSQDEVDQAVALRNQLAFTEADLINSIESYQLFIDQYPAAIEIAQAKKKRNELAYRKALRINTSDSYQSFIDTYKEADEVFLAIKQRDAILFNRAKFQNTSGAFKDFIAEYPKSHLTGSAKYKCDSLYYLENTIRNDVESHLKFIRNNGKSRYILEIQDSLYAISVRSRDFYGLKYYAENIKSEKSDSAWYYYYQVYTGDGYPATYNSFSKEYSRRFPFPEMLEEDYNTAQSIVEFIDERGLKPGKSEEFKEYLKKAGNKDIAFTIIQVLAEKLISAKNWTGALQLLNSYKPWFDAQNEKFDNLIEVLSASDKSIKPMAVNGGINTIKGGEYAPVISADNKYLYFCGRDRSDNFSREDIFVSKNLNGHWQAPKLIKEFSTEGNDAPESVSTDGNEMIMFNNADLYYSNKTVDGWSELEKFPEPINSDAWEADAMMTSDGKGLIFVSKRSGGQNYLTEDADIYICLKTDDGWSEPINLGPTINTRYSDRSPFLHPDMKTLYFASTGHGGLGSYDLFKSTRLIDTSWTAWSKPENMGREINSSRDDWGYRISTDGETAYFSAKHSNGNDDIYTLKIPAHLRPDFVATISGNLMDRSNKPIEATIRWEDLDAQKVVGQSRSNPEDGSYFIVLPLGKNYGYFVDKEDYFPVSNNVDLRKVKKAVEVKQDILMPTFKQMKDEDLAVAVNNLFFNVNSFQLLKESYPELLRVVDLIKRHNLKVEIAGHTDNTGTPEHNKELSEKRAEAVRNYLVSKNIDEQFIVTIGYGDTKPLISNDTQEGKAKNRRVEIRFLK